MRTLVLILLVTAGCSSPPPQKRKVNVRNIPADFRVVDIVVVTGRSKEKILAGIERKRPDIMNCYLSTLADDPDAKGTLTFSLRILPKGFVEKLKLEANGIGTKFMEDCVSKHVKVIKFAELTPPAVTEIPTLKFEFYPPDEQPGM